MARNKKAATPTDAGAADAPTPAPTRKKATAKRAPARKSAPTDESAKPTVEKPAEKPTRTKGPGAKAVGAKPARKPRAGKSAKPEDPEEEIPEIDDTPFIGKSVVIVESPAKAKTINKILGRDFVVRASMGHVRDLPERKFGIDLEKRFEPSYQILKTRAKTIAELRAATRKAAAVYLAPDPDREGEAIAWHLREALNLKDATTWRVTFNEITPKAVREAFEHPGKVSMDRVNAQQARRFLDRIVGYRLSPLLWKKIARGLSAGRVQSVAVKLIVDREKEIRAFKSDEYWRLMAHLLPQPSDRGNADVAAPAKSFVAELKKVNDKEAALANKAQVDELLAALQGQSYRITRVDKKERSEEPPPPFTTSTLQQQSSIRLRYTTKRTMAIAQQLYEGVELGSEGAVGLITYMRTDAVRMSEDAVQEARKHIGAHFGPALVHPTVRTYRARKGAQEAHEAIRPTSVMRTPESLRSFLTEEQFRLYSLIWKRFVSTQMTPVIFLNTDAEIVAGPATFQAKGRELKEPGFSLVAGTRLKKDEQILPPLREGQVLDLHELAPSQHFTQPPPRFTEATLVKSLEKNGIGRPSTYAPIISTIQERGYVKSEDRKLHATDLGMVVTDKLEKFFSDIMDVSFTSKIEEQLDEIEEARIDWRDVLQRFYDLFEKDLAIATDKMDSERGVTPEGAAPCEKCGKPMLIRWNKMGQFLGCSGYPECKTTRSMTPPELTGENCANCGKPMALRSGRLGKFLACTGYPECKTTKSIHMDKGAVLVIHEKCDNCGTDLVIRRGRRGPFLACPKYPDCKFTKQMPKIADLRAANAAGTPGGAGAVTEEEGEPAEGEELE